MSVQECERGMPRISLTMCFLRLAASGGLRECQDNERFTSERADIVMEADHLHPVISWTIA